MKTRMEAIDRAMRFAQRGGHRLANATREPKWTAWCKRCGAGAIVEQIPSNDYDATDMVWGCFGGVMYLSCAATLRKKQRARARREERRIERALRG